MISHRFYFLSYTLHADGTETEIEFVGEAEVTQYAEEYPGDLSWLHQATDARILSCFRVNADGTHTEVFPDHPEFNQQLADDLCVAAADCYNNPPLRPIILPGDAAPRPEGANVMPYQTWLKDAKGRDRKVWVEADAIVEGTVSIFEHGTNRVITREFDMALIGRILNEATEEARADSASDYALECTETLAA